MADDDSIPVHLARIEENLRAMPGNITAAVAAGIEPLGKVLVDHEQRIAVVEQSHGTLEKRLWGIALILFTALVGIGVKVLWQ